MNWATGRSDPNPPPLSPCGKSSPGLPKRRGSVWYPSNRPAREEPAAPGARGASARTSPPPGKEATEGDAGISPSASPIAWRIRSNRSFPYRKRTSILAG